jgi:hypothetical protein
MAGANEDVQKRRRLAMQRVVRRRNKPGDVVRRSGQYRVVNPIGVYAQREVTCVEGHRFPPAPPGFGFVLTDPTRHTR